MTATKRQVRIFEAKIAKGRPRWAETLNPAQAAFLAANAEQVAHCEQVIAHATTLPDRIAEFEQLLANLVRADESDDARMQAQAVWLRWQISGQAGPILADLRHAVAEATVAHAHHVAAAHEAIRQQRRAILAEDEVARLQAEVDQLRAELRDRTVAP